MLRCRTVPAWHSICCLLHRRGLARVKCTAGVKHPKETDMGDYSGDYVKPADVATAMPEAGRRKLALSPRDLLIRGMLSGAILGVATSLAFTGAVQTGVPLVGALIFPVGLIAIVLLGLELVTGSFALVPLPWLEREASASSGLGNWGWVFIGNL